MSDKCTSFLQIYNCAKFSCHENAFSLVFAQDQQKVGVIAASAGNHALALAFHGSDLGVPVTVVMPQVAPIMKVSLCRQYGATVVVHGADINEVCPLVAKMRNSVEFCDFFANPLPLYLRNGTESNISGKTVTTWRVSGL